MSLFLCGIGIFIAGGICGVAVMCIFQIVHTNDDRANSERLHYLIDCRLSLKPIAGDWWCIEDEDGSGAGGENPYELIDQCIAGHGP